MIRLLKSGVELYHGSFCEVRVPDLTKCRKYKDFGQGFYLTTDLEQAKRFARLTQRKAIENGTISNGGTMGVVSCFEYIENVPIETLVYEHADADWLHCVVAHRKSGYFVELLGSLTKYDVIGGKIANDATNATILTYISGIFGEIGTPNADNICISLLIPERLKDQYCFRTERALKNLAYRGVIS